MRKFGSYRNEEVVKLMQACDWIVVPSIWWENSPVVIEEAKLAGCGIICSDLGGMAEKTHDSIDLRFQAGNAPALARLMEEIALNDQAADHNSRLTRATELETSRVRAIEAHLAVYRSFFTGNQTKGTAADTSQIAPQLAVATG